MKKYIKKDTFTAISMPCTQMEYLEIKEIFDNLLLRASEYNEMPCITNNAQGDVMKLGNVINDSIFKEHRKNYKNFNKDKFLSSCGIFEVEETLPIKKETLLQLSENNSFSEEIIKKEFPQLFEQPKQLTISEIEQILGYKILIKE